MTDTSPQTSSTSQTVTTAGHPAIRALLGDAPADAPFQLREELLQRIMDSSQDCIKLLDLEGRLLFMNAGGQQLMEITNFDTLRGARWPGFWQGADRTAATAAVAAARAGGVGRFTGFCPTSTGTPKWWEVVVTPVRDAAGQPEKLLSISRDVTGRREKLALIERLNRTHAMLSGINQLIVHEREPQAILDGACRIAVEQGGFRLAWVGLTNAPGGRFRIAAHAGASPDTLAAIRATLADPQLGCAVTARVLDTGAATVCNDVRNDPLSAPWREAALARDYRAMASFPLTLDGRTAGTLNLYAAEPGLFDAEELRLLAELASDIGFALEVSRHEAERRRAEEQLGAKTVLLESMVNTSPDGILVVDSEHRKIYQNDRMAELWQFPPEVAASTDDTRQLAFAVHQTRDPEAFIARVQQLYAHPDESSYEEIELRDGTVLERYSSPVRSRDGHHFGRIWQFRDITERKQVVRALQESRHLMEQAQQVAHIGSWVSDPTPTGRLHWSAESTRIFGFAPGEFDGRVETFFALVHPEDRAAVARASEAALEGKGSYELEHRIVRRDGQTRWVHEQANVERDAAGRPVRMVGVVQDITERKQLEEQLRRAQKMEAIGQLAGGIAHDFNNILGAILGNAELVKLLPPGGREAGECLDSILAASHRAKDLVRQILAFSRRQEQRRQPMQLHHVVKEALQLMRATVPAAIEFRASLPPTPTVLADPSEIHQVTMNLCTNAWHAMKERPGLLTVELAETDVSEAFARLHPDLRPGRYARLTVADTGCGMDAATLQRIFEPFFTTKPVGEGTGLGLAVVHGIIKNHDGGIVVRSEPGRGTAFALYFPVFAAEALPPTAEPQPIPAGAGEHVLFVDDEEPLAKLGRAALERLGYRVTAQTSAAAALALFRDQPEAFDLVVTDQNMPGLSGVALGEQMLVLRPDQRLILTTGYSASLNAESARARGFRELLPKPYDLRALGEAVRRVLGETKATLT